MADHLRRDFGVIAGGGHRPLLGSKEACGFLSLAHLDPGDAPCARSGLPDLHPPPVLPRPPVPYALTEANGHPEPAARGPRRRGGSQGHPVRLLWLNYPHMPTGEARIPPASLPSRVGQGARHPRVHDNPTRASSTGAVHLLSLLAQKGRWSCIRSARATAWRAPESASPWAHRRPLRRCSASPAASAWRPLGRRRSPDAQRRNRGSEREYPPAAAGRALRGPRLHRPPGQVGMFLWARVPDGWTGDTLSDALDRRTSSSRPGFGQQRPAPPPVPVHAPRPHSGGAPTH